MSKHTKKTFVTAVLSIGAAFILTTPAHAGSINQTLTLGPPGFNWYDSSNGYDYSPGDLPPAGATIVGTFTFAIPTGNSVTGITINGFFGNGDSDTTALSDYYLGDSTDGETAVDVANCDVPTDPCADDDGAPTPWNATLTKLEIGDLANGLAGGSLDFTYTWDSTPPVIPTPGFDQYVYAGAPTIDITYAAATPEPATVLFCFSGLAGLAAFRRFRKL
jgi:hypothetical protein